MLSSPAAESQPTFVYRVFGTRSPVRKRLRTSVRSADNTRVSESVTYTLTFLHCVSDEVITAYLPLVGPLTARQRKPNGSIK